MIVLYILLGLIALIVILLHFSVRAELKASNDGFDVKVKYFWFTLYPRNKKKSAETSTDKQAQKRPSDTPLSEEQIDALKKQLEDDKKAESEPEKAEAEQPEPSELENKNEKKSKNKDKSEKKGGKLKELKAKWQMIKPYIPTGWKAVKKLLKTIRISKTDIELSVGKEDAYESAMNYGKINAAVFNGLSALSMIFTVRLKRCNINCLFNENTFKYDVSAVVYVRPSALVAIAFCTLVNFLKIFISQKLRKRKAAKQLRKANKIKINNETEMLLNE